MRADKDQLLDSLLRLLKTHGPMTAAELAGRVQEEHESQQQTATVGALARKMPRFPPRFPGISQRKIWRRLVDEALHEQGPLQTEGFVETRTHFRYALTAKGHSLLDRGEQRPRPVRPLEPLEQELARKHDNHMFEKGVLPPDWRAVWRRAIVHASMRAVIILVRACVGSWNFLRQLRWPEALKVSLNKAQKIKLAAFAAASVLILGLAAYFESQSSFFQSQFFAKRASHLTYQMASGPSDAIRFPDSGPFDHRLGYSLIPRLLERTLNKGFTLEAQARLSPEHRRFVDIGLYPIYHEKNQAGLTILDRTGTPLFTSMYPQLIYERFEDIPEVIVKTLLFIENRTLLDERYPRRNPTLDYERLGRAVLDMLISQFIGEHDVPGGSTLATQIEKYRHSPDGRTSGVREKLRQMASATFRAYQDGPDTMNARRRVVRDYINSVPLGAIPGAGEVRGLGHGMVAWHGANFNKVNELLKDVRQLDGLPDDVLKAKARAYKEMLSLFLSQRRPAYYLQSNREALKALTDKHLGILARAGVISEPFRQLVAQAPLAFRNNMIMFQPERLSFIERKAANAVRVHLLPLFGFDRLYSLDRLDLQVTSTIDLATQRAVSDILQRLKDPKFAAESGLLGERLLARGDPSSVIYSFTLRERVGNANVLRVQADNVDGPFNVSEGGKLELGSTAKLRTLISYLEVVENMWARYAHATVDELKAMKLHPNDHLGEWCVNWLQTAKDKTLQAMLDASMDRTYSASPAEVFFTGGGAHRFNNFQVEDNSKIPTIRESLKRSINLPFVRIMRDIVYFHIGQIQGSWDMLQDIHNPLRKQYLTRFANKEGRQFLGRFFMKYRGMSSDDVMKTFLTRLQNSPRRLAAAYSVIKPGATTAEYQAFLAQYLPKVGKQPKDLDKIISNIQQGEFNLHDKGYIAGVHPLELWLVAYLHRSPKASFSQVMDASVNQRQEVYDWLLNSKNKAKQDSRIRIMLEQEAFQSIHQSWQRLGYPFSSLVPTYATALGSSGDKPVALAELMGVIVGGGVRYTGSRVDAMHFAEATPFETKIRASYPEGTRVLSAELANTAMRALSAVVDEGTAIRVKGSFKTDDGKVLQIGGKTGTGDNRYSVFAPGGRVIESKVMSRTATFVFFIGDRFFGTLTAYVPGSANAENFSFTSALPVQILKVLSPKLMPLIGKQVVMELPN